MDSLPGAYGHFNFPWVGMYELAYTLYHPKGIY